MAGISLLLRRHWLAGVTMLLVVAALFCRQDDASARRVWNVLVGDSFRSTYSKLLGDYFIHAIALDTSDLHEPSLIVLGMDGINSSNGGEIHRIPLRTRASDRFPWTSAFSASELIAGNGEDGTQTHSAGGQATETPLARAMSQPVVLANGDLAFVESCSQDQRRVRHISKVTGVITTVAGFDKELRLSDGAAMTVQPEAIAAVNNDLIIGGADKNGLRHVLKLPPLKPDKNWIGTPIIGGGEKPLSQDFQDARSVKLTKNLRYMVVRPNGAILAVAGNGLIEAAPNDGGKYSVRAVTLARPLPEYLYGLALDNDGFLLVLANYSVLRFASNFETLRPIIGRGVHGMPRIHAGMTAGDYLNPRSIAPAPDGGLFIHNGTNQLLYIDNNEEFYTAAVQALFDENDKRQVFRDFAKTLITGVKRKAEQVVPARDVVKRAAYQCAPNECLAPKLDQQVFLSRLPRDLHDELARYVDHNFTNSFFERMRAEMVLDMVATNPDYKELRKYLWWSSWGLDLLTKPKSWLTRQ